MDTACKGEKTLSPLAWILGKMNLKTWLWVAGVVGTIWKMSKKKHNVKVVIDPGHGGRDPGATNAQLGLKESEINLWIARALERITELRGAEYGVVLTRKSDRAVKLKARTDLANKYKVPIVSIHCNAGKPSANGVETWCFAKTDKDGNASREYKFANAIQRELATLGLVDRGVKAIYDRQAKKYIYRKLWILRHTDKPGVIVECGFISNSKEAAKLKSDVFKEKIAWALYRGIAAALRSERGMPVV